MDELTQCLNLIFSPATAGMKIQALVRISDLGLPMHVRWFFYLLFDEDRDVAFAAADAVSRLMQKVDSERWTSLYPSLRSINIIPLNVARLDEFPADQAVYLLGVASLNCSGFVREESLRRLGAIRSPAALPYILLRLADWVPQVRDLAHNLVQSALERGLVFNLLTFLPLLQWMDRVKRTDIKSIRLDFIQAARMKNPQELRRGLDNELREIRYFCYRALLTDLDEQADLVEKAMEDPDVGIRSWLVTKIAAGQPREARRWLGRLLVDKSPQIRIAVLRSIPEALWQSLEPQIIPMILDDSIGVREAARFYLNKHGIRDFAERYRFRLEDASGNAAPGLIAGIAETGNLSDCHAIVPYMTHARPKVRAAAITGLVRLKSKGVIAHLIEMMNDRSNKVRKVVVLGLLQHKSAETRELVLPLLERGTCGGRVATLNLLVENGGWEALRDILYAIAEGEDCLRHAGWSQLRKWLSQYSRNLYTKPSSEILEDALQFISRAEQDPRLIDPEFNQDWKEVSELVQGVQMNNK